MAHSIDLTRFTASMLIHSTCMAQGSLQLVLQEITDGLGKCQPA